MLKQQSVITISDATHVGEARRTMTQLARIAGMSETESGEAAIIATELANNLVKHTQGGEISLGLLSVAGHAWIEVMTLDRGPGMQDVGKCMQDGYSTRGSPGTGLGAVRRLSTEFDIHSTPANGTVVFSRRVIGKHEPKPHLFEWGSASRPISPGLPSGDCWRIAEQPGALAVMVADGLGHGDEAAAASARAAMVFENEPFLSGPLFLEKAHAEMRGTRGAAIAISHIYPQAGEIQYTGIGNIASHIEAIHDETPGQGLVSHGGIVGVNQRKPVQFNYRCPSLGLLIMHSDGLRSRWVLRDYPGLVTRHPALIAGVLYRDFKRGRDDVTVVVVRITMPTSATTYE